ncbi:MAG: serine/threonine-protein kinase, partial [Pirellulaceae bacterium]
MAVHQRIDRICDQYRSAWRCGQPRTIEEFLGDADTSDRGSLLVQLIVVEAELRGESGEQTTAEEFERRFPHDRPSVALAMSLVRKRTKPDDPAETKAFAGPAGAGRPAPRAGIPRPPVSLLRSRNREEALPEIEGYELLEEIGRGGMGIVFKARQIRLGRIVALKLIRPDHTPREEEIKRFEREAAAAAQLDHPGIVSVFDAGKHEGWPFYAMSYVAGCSLAEKLEDGPLAPRQAAEIARQIAQAMGCAHRQGIVHRDLKPANVLIDEQGRARITDFGLAKLLDAAARLTASGMVIGSFPFMSPEQALGRNHLIGPATDIYSIGIILYAMLVGQPPFGGNDPVSVLDKVKYDMPRPVTALRSDVDVRL